MFLMEGEGGFTITDVNINPQNNGIHIRLKSKTITQFRYPSCIAGDGIDVMIPITKGTINIVRCIFSATLARSFLSDGSFIKS